MSDKEWNEKKEFLKKFRSLNSEDRQAKVREAARVLCAAAKKK